MKRKKNEAQNSEAHIEKLADEICSAVYKSMEALWSAFLEIGELGMVRAAEKVLRRLVSHGDYAGAMKLLEGIYALVEIMPHRDTDQPRAPVSSVHLCVPLLPNCGKAPGHTGKLAYLQWH